MNIPRKAVVGFLLTALVFTVPAAQAQDSGSTTIGKTTITIGSGVTFLSLPEAESMVTRGQNFSLFFPVYETYKFSDDFEEIGWNVNGSVAVPVGWATLSLNGFWARFKDQNSFLATPQPTQAVLITPLVDNPAIQQVQGTVAGVGYILADADREVDQWGGALEMKWGLDTSFADWNLAVGVDVRGIYQDLDADMFGTFGRSFLVSYKEDLDTTYYGAYLAWGGNYAPFLFESWGLEASFLLRGGVYYAYTDYDGTLVNSGPIIGGGGDPTSSLSLSSDDAAFIGGITLGIRKRLGTRAILSLEGGYEYYSFVPRMSYNTVDQGPLSITGGREFGTSIDSDDGYSLSAGLRLTIEL